MTDPQPDPLDLTPIRKRLKKVEGIGDDHTTWWQIGTHDAPALVAEVEGRRREVERLRGLLRRLEWAHDDYCPVRTCGFHKSAGRHAADCDLAAAIRSTSGEEQ